MNSFAFLSLGIDGNGIEIFCTHLPTLDWAVDEIKKFMPDCKVLPDPSWGNLITGEICRYNITKLDYKDRELGNWLLQQLCLKGWEPISSSYHDDYKLRYVIPK